MILHSISLRKLSILKPKIARWLKRKAGWFVDGKAVSPSIRDSVPLRRKQVTPRRSVTSFVETLIRTVSWKRSYTLPIRTDVFLSVLCFVFHEF